MPRYHFHSEDGECFADPTGTELPDAQAAKHHALDVLLELLKGRPQLFWNTENFRIIVTSDDNLTLFELYLAVARAPAASLSEAGRERRGVERRERA